MRVGQARKRDANEDAITRALAKIGVRVQRINVKDFADLICFDGRTRRLVLIEIKNPKGKDRVSEGQRENHAIWPVAVVRSVEESLALFEKTS